MITPGTHGLKLKKADFFKLCHFGLKKLAKNEMQFRFPSTLYLYSFDVLGAFLVLSHGFSRSRFIKKQQKNHRDSVFLKTQFFDSSVQTRLSFVFCSLG